MEDRSGAYPGGGGFCPIGHARGERNRLRRLLHRNRAKSGAIPRPAKPASGFPGRQSRPPATRAAGPWSTGASRRPRPVPRRGRAGASPRTRPGAGRPRPGERPEDPRRRSSPQLARPLRPRPPRPPPAAPPRASGEDRPPAGHSPPARAASRGDDREGMRWQRARLPQRLRGGREVVALPSLFHDKAAPGKPRAAAILVRLPAPPGVATFPSGASRQGR
jgi:hypothetical protein